jgi:putative phosphoribosyl transferase
LDRRAAGIQLSKALAARGACVVVGIARGGVCVAAPVARALHAPLDVMVVRKVGHPMQPELAIGAVCADGDAVTTEHAAGIPQALARSLFSRARAEALELEQRLRPNQEAIELAGRPVIIVDDGIATAASMLCAIAAVRKRNANFITVAVPVAPAQCALALRSYCDELLALIASRELPFAVGRFYVSFGQVSDERVRLELERARSDAP